MMGELSNAQEVPLHLPAPFFLLKFNYISSCTMPQRSSDQRLHFKGPQKYLSFLVKNAHFKIWKFL